MVPAGRRSGKTEVAKRKLVLELWDCKVRGRAWSDPRFFAAAPTRDQAKRIYWKDLKKLTPPVWVKSISETDMCITTTWGAELWVVGLDKAERIEGVSWDGGVIDELASCRPGIWDANIRPALSDRLGWAWLIGVPDMDSPGQVEYEAMVDRAKSGKDPEWACFSWPSADILPASEVESARSSMDPRIFEQEYLGKFILAGGRAFPDFDVAIHVNDEIAKYDPALPLCWALDFNVNPMCSGVIQHHNGEVRVIDELSLPDTVTRMACVAFLDRAQQRGWKLDNLNIYGDASGNQRRSVGQTAGITDWIIIRNELRHIPLRMKVPGSNPPIPDTRNAVNTRLKSADGIVRMYINSKCRTLIHDLRSLLWPSDMDEGHAVAWLRYFTDWEYPIRSNRPASAMQAAVL